MKLISKLSLFISIITLITFSSCSSDEITKIQLDKTTLSFNVGQLDSLVATVNFSGDLGTFPLKWVASNPDIVSITESITTSNQTKSSSSSSYSKTIIFRALKEGTTSVIIQAGEKTISCDITVGKQNIIMDKAFAANWGDYYEIGSNNFVMYMFDKNLSVDSAGNILGDGSYLVIDLIVPITQNYMTAGTYTFSNNGENNTFLSGVLVENNDGTLDAVGTYLVSKKGTVITTTLLVGGDFTIVGSGDIFTFEGDFIAENNEEIHFAFQGPINVNDLRETPVELTPNFTKGRLVYFGDSYETLTTNSTKVTKPSNNYYVILATENEVFNDSVLTGELVYLEINTDTIAKNYIPNGTYTSMSDLTFNFLVPGSIVFGYTTTNDDLLGSWYFGETEKALRTGSAVFSKTGENYSIQYQFFDKIGSKVSGTYNGPLEFINNSITASKVKAYNINDSNSKYIVNNRKSIKVKSNKSTSLDLFMKKNRIKR